MPDRPPARLWTIFARVDLGLLKSVSVSLFSLPLYLSLYLSLSVSLSVCLSLSVSLSVCLSLCLSLSVCLSVCLSLTVSKTQALKPCLTSSGQVFVFLCVSLVSQQHIPHLFA